MSAKQAYLLPDNVRQTYFEKRLQAIAKYAPIFEQLLAEPYVVDDYFRVPVDQFLGYAVTQCETLICREGDNVVGVAMFMHVIPTRSAEILAWIAPEYRKDNYAGQKAVLEFIRDDIFPYAWETLNLPRVEAIIATPNKSSIALVENIGFRKIGTARLDLQFFGQLSDSFRFELINPAYEIGEVEELIHGRESAELRSTDYAGDQFETEPDDESSVGVPDSDSIRSDRRKSPSGFAADGEDATNLFAADPE